MTRTKAKELLPVITHYANGGEIETSTFGELWEVVTDESALWTAKYYRPKPIDKFKEGEIHV